MAKKQPKQSAAPRKGGNPTNGRQTRSGTPAQQKQANNTSAKKSSKKANKEPMEPITLGGILWRLGLILCVGLVIFSLLFASINGGSRIIGLTYDEPNTENTTPTPPVADIDSNINITGSDATPIPPSPTPGVDTAVEGGTEQTAAP